jgi:hypothetical protein
MRVSSSPNVSLSSGLITANVGGGGCVGKDEIDNVHF